jgi:hypothetical protein
VLTSETTVETGNASRYLARICAHAGKMGHGLQRLHGRAAGDRPDVLDVEWSDTQGVLSLSWGRCTFDAGPTTLTVRVDAADEERLRGVQRIVTDDLERLGRREQLSVSWGASEPGAR